MADRKSSLLSRFWPPSSTRRTSTTAPPPATTTTPPRAETKAPARQATTKAATTTTSPPAPTTPPRTQPRKADQPSGEVQKANSQQTTAPSTESKDKSKASSPSLASTQSRSPPQPSSPPPSTPKRAPKPPSPSRATSGSPKPRPSSSPKAKLPASSPSKPTKTISAPHEAPTSPSKERDPEPAAPQQPEIKEEIKPDSTTTPAIIECLDSSSITTLDAKPEVVEATNAEANEETKKVVIDSNPTKEILAAPSADAAASQPTERSSNLRVRDKSAPENEEQVQLNNQMAKGDPKKAISSDKPVNVIMLAGENRGASMQMESKSSKREEPVHIHRSYKTNPDENESPEATTTDAEEISEGEERSMEDQVMEAYVNNNAQGINNSIVFNSSIVEGNPGVHMVVNHLPKEQLQSKDATSGTETRRAEVNMSRAEKLTYQPTIKRRCLRGLLLETSNSDSEKPRRHGCRVGCQKKDRENNIDVS